GDEQARGGRSRTFSVWRSRSVRSSLLTRPRPTALLIVGWAVILVSCTGPTVSSSGRVAAGLANAAVKKHLVAGIFSDPEGFQRNLTNPGGGGGTRAAGLIETENLVHAALVFMDEDGVLR